MSQPPFDPSRNPPPPPPPPPYVDLTKQPQQPSPYAGGPPPGAPVPAPGGYPVGWRPDGPVGTVRSTGLCFLLMVVTLGFYSLYWYYVTHDEMKRHTGQGLDGGIALLIGIFVGIVMSFLTPNDVGALYERKGWTKPVSAVTGLWALLLGWFFFVGLIVWFVKTNGALNAYWRSQGAVG